ncbi:MAG: restriction endonuclease subunit S [Pseudoalteromonas nigrifaciens]
MVRCVDLGYGPLNLDNTKSVDESVYLEYSRRYAPAKGDIIITRVGANFGVTSYVDETNFCLGQNTAAIVPKINPKYLYYILNSEKCRHQMSVLVAGAAQPTLSLKAIKALDIPRLGKELEDKIANVIGDINDKISVNQKTNQTLEQMAQAFFKSWFVDFDPVFDNLLASADFKLENLETSLPDELKQKAQRRLAALNSLHNAAEIKASLSTLAHELQAQLPTKEATQSAVQAAETPVKANFNDNPNILAQHANTHAHFPNEFEHNEQLGWIPKGWSTFKFEDICVAKQGKYLAKDKMTEVPDEESYFAVWGGNGIRGYSCNYMYEEPVVVLTCRGSNCGLIDLTLAKAWVSNISFACTPRLGSVNFLHLLLSSINFSDCTSGSAQPQITYTSIKNKQIFYPLNSQVVNKFSGIIDKLYSKKIHNTEQNKSLSKLRDTLLPKLISGELQIPDVAIDE